jgi:hypothetical protein
MENFALEIAQEEIEKKSARCRELDEKRRSLLSRIDKAESARQSVREPIYLKVRDEYEQRLRALEGELEPLIGELEQSRASVDERLKQIDTQANSLRDALDELIFRHRVGEFDEQSLEERKAPLEEELQGLEDRRRDLTDMLNHISTLGSAPCKASAGSEPRAEKSPVGPTAHAGSTPPIPVRTPPPAPGPQPFHVEEAVDEHDSSREDTEGADAFVDVTEWVGEFVHDESAEDTRNDESPTPTATAPPHLTPRIDPSENPPQDQLTDLADPLEESSDWSEEDAVPRDDGTSFGSSLPILAIKSGPGAGKKLPLLPVSMTIGREVDNNIELKDEDVARYHARVSYDAGKYVIEDVEGSSGTFVNGKRITKAALAAGDVIRVGGTELSIDLG